MPLPGNMMTRQDFGPGCVSPYLQNSAEQRKGRGGGGSRNYNKEEGEEEVEGEPERAVVPGFIRFGSAAHARYIWNDRFH